MFGMAPPTLQPLTSKMFKDLSSYLLRAFKCSASHGCRKLAFLFIFPESYWFMECIAYCYQIFYYVLKLFAVAQNKTVGIFMPVSQ